jgi:putative flippase GtrA
VMKDWPQPKVVRYIASGLLSFLVEIVSFMISFYAISAGVEVSNIISISIAVVVNFVVSKHYVFKGSNGSARTRRQFMRYSVLVGINLVVSTILVSRLVKLDVPAYVAKPFVTLLVAAWTYIAYKRAIFK